MARIMNKITCKEQQNKHPSLLKKIIIKKSE